MRDYSIVNFWEVEHRNPNEASIDVCVLKYPLKLADFGGDIGNLGFSRLDIPDDVFDWLQENVLYTIVVRKLYFDNKENNIFLEFQSISDLILFKLACM